MLTLFPLLNHIPHLMGMAPEFWSTATEIWEVAPGEKRQFPPAIFLKEQMERVRETVFGGKADTVHALTTSIEQFVAPTLAASFRKVLLSDGVLYNKGSEYHIAPRRKRLPIITTPKTNVSGALYDSWIGSRYFGNWLMDDCETYRLAENVGTPVTIRKGSEGHRQRYEERLSISPLRLDSAQFDELVLFKDLPNNSGKMARAADRRTRLLAGKPPIEPHPGVFLKRGRTGDTRLLVNEDALAEQLAGLYGFKVLQAEEHSVDELIDACAGARILIGVEGSQLTHALAVMSPGSTMLALFPPDRVTAAMKLMTDRLGMHFALVIGTGTTNRFEIDLDEVRATIDLIP